MELLTKRYGNFVNDCLFGNDPKKKGSDEEENVVHGEHSDVSDSDAVLIMASISENCSKLEQRFLYIGCSNQMQFTRNGQI